MNYLKLSLLMIVTALSFQGHAQSLTMSKAAELACHRIERLVTLKRIDASFQDKIYALQIVKLTGAAAGQPAYKATAIQVPGADGTFKKVEILMDDAGKGLSQNVVAGTEGSAPGWPDKDPVSLTENALHYVLENGPTKAEVKPFYTGLTEISLAQAKDAQGKVLANFSMKSSETPKVLLLTLKSDGTVAGPATLK